MVFDLSWRLALRLGGGGAELTDSSEETPAINTEVKLFLIICQ